MASLDKTTCSNITGVLRLFAAPDESDLTIEVEHGASKELLRDGFGSLVPQAPRGTEPEGRVRCHGISISYLSEVERGLREPGLKLLTRLAGLYNVDVRDLVRCAGLSDYAVPDPRIDEEAEVGRAFEYVMADPRFRFGTRPSGPMSLDAKRFIVEMYERFSGKRFLD